MKIAIIGYSGSGKSSLASQLGRHYGILVLYLDQVHFRPGWQEVSNEEMIPQVQTIMDQAGWIIDGNYSGVLYSDRMVQADQIIFMNFGRLRCLWRAFKRYLTYNGSSRPNMAPACPEKLDLEFIRWILWEGRQRKQRDRCQVTCSQYADKVLVLKNQKQVDDYLDRLLLFKEVARKGG